MKDATKPVTFRLGTHYHAKLTELGEEEGCSRGKIARQLVTAALEGGDKQEILEAVASLREDLDELRQDLGWALGTLLINVTDIDGDQIRQLLVGRFGPGRS